MVICFIYEEAEWTILPILLSFRREADTYILFLSGHVFLYNLIGQGILNRLKGLSHLNFSVDRFKRRWFEPTLKETAHALMRSIQSFVLLFLMNEWLYHAVVLLKTNAGMTQNGKTSRWKIFANIWSRAIWYGGVKWYFIWWEGWKFFVDSGRYVFLDCC